jgi:histidyl-tRNA synthetase
LILEHEIPKGSQLYFGKSAKAKRDFEHKISDFLLKVGFEEIVSPHFSYSNHQAIEDTQKLIQFFDEENHPVALRADSTLDIVRIVLRRLSRSTDHKKWFYIQPVFSYPTNEHYQIGCEWIGHDDIFDLILLNLESFQILDLSPYLQISNISIIEAIVSHNDIDIELFRGGKIDELYQLQIDWLSLMIDVKDIQDLRGLLGVVPSYLSKEIEKMIDIASRIDYDRMIISPLYYPSMKYYDDICYRFIFDNYTLSKGGKYKSGGLNSLGFALYTDNILKVTR